MEREGFALAGLWANCFWISSLILLVSGYGRFFWSQARFRAAGVAMAGALVMAFDLLLPQVPLMSGTVNGGLAFLALATLALGIARRKPVWWLWWLSLGAIAALGRILAPLAPHRAQWVMPLVPESIVLGIAAGVLGEEPVGGIVVGIGADVLASMWILVVRGGPLALGYHDLTSALLAGLAGWAAGWMRFHWGRHDMVA